MHVSQIASIFFRCLWNKFIIPEETYISDFLFNYSTSSKCFMGGTISSLSCYIS